MKCKFLKVLVAVTALCLTVSGCGTANPAQSTLPDIWGSTSNQTSAIQTDSSQNTDSNNGGGNTSDPNQDEQRDFGDSGSILSMRSGNLLIERLTRDEEVSMGGDKWTILVYMCGTDLESQGYAASADLYEAIDGAYNDEVNFVFQTGGANSWYYNDINASKIQHFVVEENDYRLVDERPIANMGDPDTLADFVEWGVKQYPAENIGLVFWNHGGGSISGVCFDERYNYDSLTISEIDKALSSTYSCMTEKFEFIGFDACLMSTLETANVLVPYANYMYASEEIEPGNGWDYTAILDYLHQNPDADGAQLGRKVCDAYYQHSKLSSYEDVVTFAITDLTKIDALIQSFNLTAQQMYESNNFRDIVKAIQDVDNFGGNNRTEGYTNMVDLGGIMNAVSAYCPNAADTLNKLDDCISYMRNGYQHAGSRGLAVYYPLAVQGSSELSTFGTICPSTYYLAFVDKAAYGTTGYDVDDYDNNDLLGDFNDIWDIDFDYGDYSTNTDEFSNISATATIPVQDIYFDDDGYYTVVVSDYSNFSYASCSLFMQIDDNTAVYLGCDDEVHYYDDGRITDNFDGTWVSLPDGQPLPIEVVDRNDDFSLYTCPILLNGEYTNLRIEYDWNGTGWNIIGAWDGIDDNTNMASRDIIELEKGDVIQPVYYYTDYNSIDYFSGDKYVYNGGSIDLSYQMLPASDYTFSITLNDIYGNWYFTPEVTFTVESDGGLTFYPDELENFDIQDFYNGGSGVSTGGSGNGGSSGGSTGGLQLEEGDTLIDCPECGGTGCFYCGYYGQMIRFNCSDCNGYGCANCNYKGTFIAVACPYCSGYICEHCEMYYDEEPSGGSSSIPFDEDELVDCPECYGSGCFYCGYYGYLLEYDCPDCYGAGCSYCNYSGGFLAIACPECLGAGCSECEMYY